MTSGELMVVITGMREDWPLGASLTPRESRRGRHRLVPRPPTARGHHDGGLHSAQHSPEPRRCLRLSGSTVERLRHSRRVRRRVPRSRAGGRRAPRWRRPRASGHASPTDPKSGNGRLGFSPATGGPAAPAAGDKARPIQVGGPRRHRPRRRGGGSEAEAVARERGRLTAVIAGMRRSEVSARRPPFVVLLKSGCAPMEGSPPQCHVHSVLLHLCCLKH